MYAMMYMFMFFNHCKYHFCQPLYTSIVHTLYIHGSDLSVTVTIHDSESESDVTVPVPVNFILSSTVASYNS